MIISVRLCFFGVHIDLLIGLDTMTRVSSVSTLVHEERMGTTVRQPRNFW